MGRPRQPSSPRQTSYVRTLECSHATHVLEGWVAFAKQDLQGACFFPGQLAERPTGHARCQTPDSWAEEEEGEESRVPGHSRRRLRGEGNFEGTTTFVRVAESTLLVGIEAAAAAGDGAHGHCVSEAGQQAWARRKAMTGVDDGASTPKS